MEFRIILYNIFLCFLVFYFSFSIYDAITLPKDVFYTLVFFFIVSTIIQLHKSLLVFLTVSRAFLTVLIAVSILVGVTLYLLDYTMPGLYINEIEVNNYDFQFISTQATTIGKGGIIFLISVTTGLFYSIIDSLKKGG